MKRTQFHWNINEKLWSYVPNKTLHCSQAVLVDVVVRHPSFGNQHFVKCHNGTGSRKVFAWFKAVDIYFDPVALTDIPADAERIHFDPTKGDTHFHVRRNGEKIIVDHLSKAWATKGGVMLAIVHTTNGVMK